jgi:hypothetical protein
LFTHGREVAADFGEVCCADKGAEATGDFFLDFHHAQILLGLVIGERDARVVEERQDIRLMDLESAAQGACFGAQRRTSAGEDVSVAPDPAFSEERRDVSVLLAIRVHAQKQAFEAVCPKLMFFFGAEDEFAQMMGIAKTMIRSIVPIRDKAVMDEAAFEVREQKEIVDGDLTSVSVNAVPGQLRCAGDMEQCKRPPTRRPVSSA